MIGFPGFSFAPIDINAAFNNSLIPALNGGLKNKDYVNKCVQDVKNIVSSVSGVISQQLEIFIDTIKK